MISADIDCDYGLTAVNISSYNNTHQNQKHRIYSSLNVVTTPWLKTEDTTLDINFQQNWIRKFVKYNLIVHRLIKPEWYSMFAYFQSSSIAYKELVYA